MAHSDALEHVARKLATAKTYSEIFGALPPGDVASKRTALKRQFANLAMMVHPDHNPDESKKAGDAFNLLNRLRQGAEEAIVANAYDREFAAGSIPDARSNNATFEIRSGTTVYRFKQTAFATGDFSVLYRGETGAGIKVIAKVSTTPTMNTWLERDALVLKKFTTASAGDPLAGVARFVPKLIETFLMEGEKGTRYRVNIMKDVPDLVSVADIVKAYPTGLETTQAVWIFRRILAQTLAASMAGVVHGAMVPDHILVDPYKREPMHIGWAHSIDAPVQDGKRITHVIKRWRDLYPPEVFDKKVPDHRTDFYMASKTMIVLLGGDAKRNTLPRAVPKSVGEVLLRSVEPSPARRPSDGVQLLDDFTRVIRAEWGVRYQPLMMPVQ